MSKLLIVEWYDQKVHSVVAPRDIDTLHSLCEAVENSSYVKHWRIVGLCEGELQFYQNGLWKKMEEDIKVWFK